MLRVDVRERWQGGRVDRESTKLLGNFSNVSVVEFASVGVGVYQSDCPMGSQVTYAEDTDFIVGYCESLGGVLVKTRNKYVAQERQATGLT